MGHGEYAGSTTQMHEFSYDLLTSSKQLCVRSMRFKFTDSKGRHPYH